MLIKNPIETRSLEYIKQQIKQSILSTSKAPSKCVNSLTQGNNC